jgi:hypothetical protein
MLEVEGSTLHHNNASRDGGALLMMGTAHVSMHTHYCNCASSVTLDVARHTIQVVTNAAAARKASVFAAAVRALLLAFRSSSGPSTLWQMNTCLKNLLLFHLRVTCSCMQLTVHNCSLHDNSAAVNGGAVFLGTDSNALIRRAHS